MGVLLQTKTFAVAKKIICDSNKIKTFSCQIWYIISREFATGIFLWTLKTI